MAERFRGQSTHKIDAKGRVSIPALFRRVLEAEDPDWTDGLEANLLIFYGDASRNCLEVYTQAAVNRMDTLIDALPKGSKERRKLEKTFYGNSFPSSIDNTGRLVLNAALREAAGLKSDAYFLGVGETFEIWNPEIYKADEDDDGEVDFFALVETADRAERAARAE